MCVLLADDGRRPRWHRGAGRDADRLARPELVRRRSAGARLGDDRERTVLRGGDDRVAIHRGAREGRDVAGGLDVGGEHAIERVLHPDRLGRQALRGAEGALSCLFDRDQRLGHLRGHSGVWTGIRLASAD